VSFVVLIDHPTTRREDKVDNRGQVDPALIGPNADHIGDPSLIGSVDLELALQNVRRDRQHMVGVRGSSKSAPSTALNAKFAHQPFDSLPANSNALRAQFAMNARASVRTTTALMRRDDVHGELSIGRCPRRHRALLPGVEAARRDSEDSAHRADGEGHLLRFDESEFHSLSFAKKVAAHSITQRNEGVVEGWTMSKRRQRGLSVEQRAELWTRWKEGQSLSDIGRALDKAPGSVSGFLRVAVASLRRRGTEALGL
jgi:hypothetical protein